MSRDIETALKAASQASTLHIVLLVKIEYDSGNVCLHSGHGTITYDGNDYLGVGQYGSISAVSEDSELSASYIDLTLSGIDSALLATQLQEYYQGNTATIYFGIIDDSDGTLISPTIIYKGLVDNSTISLGKSGSITIRVNNRLAAWDRVNDRRYNNADQQSVYPGDRAFEFVEGIQEKELSWGR